MRSTIEDNKQCSFFSWIRDHTFYSVFRKALIDSQSLSDSDESLLKALHLMLVAGIFLLLFALGINLLVASPKTGSDLGTFGDFLGGVLNPIFTLMTFFGVIVTIALQKLELRAAREEYKKSADALSTQAVENTFFNMLNLHHKIVSGLSFTARGLEIKKALITHERMFDNMIDDGNITIENLSSFGGNQAFSGFMILLSNHAITHHDVVALYRYIQRFQNHFFGTYFRNLYQIMRFIDEHEGIDFCEKNKYIKILRAQLSRDELSVLFINCIGNIVDNGQFRALIKKYHMLEHMLIQLDETQSILVNNIMVKRGSYFTGGMVPIADHETIKEFLSDESYYYGAFGRHPCFTEQ